ncbi:MAG: hypothetical protein C4524_12175 [Candidatus Zixiibacteriota bacterium]|nr:MAG: hypothetical protein C4524_12175 [candidate division Zixibacteria bacterium]
MLNGDRAIGWIIGLALALRLAVIPLLGNDPSNQSLFEYGHIAWNIVQGHGFAYDFDGRYPLQPTAYSPALYCYALVPWFAVFGINFLGPRIMHAVFLAAVCWFLYKIGARLISRRAGLVAAALWAVYPEAIFLTLRLAPENLMFPLFGWTLWRAVQTDHPRPGRNALVTGGLLGLACWTNPSLQVLGLAIPLHWKINGFLRGRAGWKRFGLFVMGAVLVIAPWTIRNYLRLGAFVPLRSAFAYNMWRGNHEGATGTVRNFQFINVDVALPEDYKAYIDANLDPTDEIARDRFFAAEVKKFIREHPGEFLRLTGTRVSYYWWQDKTHPLTGSLWYMAPWVLLLIPAAAGVILTLRRWRSWSLWYLQILGFTTLFALTVVVPRYRLPLYPALILLAAAGVEAGWRRLSERHRPGG